MPRVWIRKTSPLFWHLSFYFSKGIFDSHLRRLIFSFVYSRRYLISLSRVGILWYLFGTYCVLVPKVFWFRPFERSNPLGVCFRTCCAFWCRRFFGSDLLKGRSPLAFGLHLLCLSVPNVFWFGPFNRSKPLGVCLASTYCAFGSRRFFGSDLLIGRSPLAFV